MSKSLRRERHVVLRASRRVVRALLDDAPTGVALVAAALVGLVLFVRIFGTGYLLGRARTGTLRTATRA